MTVASTRALRVLTSALVALSGILAAGGVGANDVDPLVAEARAASVQAQADAAGALGIYWDDTTGELVVLMPTSRVGRFSEAQAELSGAAVRVESSAIEPADIDAVADRLTGRAWHPQASAASFGFYFDPRSRTVRIEGDSAPEVFAAVGAEFPGLTQYSQVAVAARQSRISDLHPHHGGAATKREGAQGGGDCTSGFAVKNPAHKYMVTAAHCYQLGWIIESPGSGDNFGSVVARGPFPQWDAELIESASFSGYLYVGNTTGTLKKVIAAGDPTVGFTGYCTSTWHQTGTLCGKTVNSLNGTYCDQAGCTNGLIAYTGGTLTVFGDSGAPFILESLNGVSIRGLHIAISGSTMYAHKWSTISSHWGVSIILG